MENNIDIEEQTKGFFKSDIVVKAIFGTEKTELIFFKDSLTPYCLRMIELTFILFYLIWRNEDLRKKYIGSHRVSAYFEKVYDTQTINIDFIIFVLIELQIYSQGNKGEPIETLIRGDESIYRWKDAIKGYIHSYRKRERNLELLQEMYCHLLRSFPILGLLEGSVDENTVLSFLLPENEMLPTFGLMRMGADYTVEYVRSISIIEGECLVEYATLDEKIQYTKSCTKKEYDQICLFSNLRREKKDRLNNNDYVLTHKLYGDNFILIRNLALSISDILDFHTRQRLYETYAYIDEFEEVFALIIDPDTRTLSNSGHLTQHWDSIITILIIERGPTEILQFIIEQNEKDFENILHRLEKRKGEAELYQKYMDEYSQNMSLESLSAKSGYYLGIKSWIKRFGVDLMVQTLIKATASQMNESHYKFVESLPMRIEQLRKIRTLSHLSKRDKVHELSILLERTFRFILVFFKGLQAYSKAKSENEQLMNSSESKDQCFVYKKAFQVAAEKELANCKKSSLDTLYKALIKFIKDVDSQKSPAKKRLEYLIGRSYVCELNKLNEYYNGSGKNALSIAAIRNSFSHDSVEPKKKTFSLDIISHLLDRGVSILNLFHYNKHWEIETILNHCISVDPVYPYVLQFYSQNVRREGYVLSSYHIKDEEWWGSDIKVLTTLQLDTSKYYYCIPNLNSSTKRWWIDPFLIECDFVDSIFYGEELTSEADILQDADKLMIQEKGDA